ncbi:MAG TPA: hypothetical protein VKZ18_14355 [Polyangia bacterium]|nr:hypothetical protein [Polyangia bacterium]
MTRPQTALAWTALGALAIGAMIACAPLLRDQDERALQDVQKGLAATANADGGTGFQRIEAKSQYCAIDSVLVAADRKGANQIVCLRDGGGNP